MRLQNVVYACRDLAQMVDFYRDGLGLEVFFQNDTCGFLKLGGTYLALYLAKPDEPVTSGAMLDVVVSDLEATIHQLRERGLEVRIIDGHPVVTDPAGNRVEFVAESN